MHGMADAPTRAAAAPSMRLQRRLVMMVVASLLAVLGVDILLVRPFQRESEARLANAEMAAEASRLTAAVMEIRSTALVAAAQRIAEAPGVPEGIAAENATAVGAAVRPLLQGQEFIRVEVTGPRGAMLFAVRPAGTSRDAVDAGVLAQVRDTGQPLVGPAREEDGGVVLRATVPVGTARPDRPASGTVTVQVSIEGMLRNLAERNGADVFLVGARGALLSGTSPRLWEQLGTAVQQGTGRRLVEHDDHIYAVVTLPLLDETGGRLGALVQVRDVTAAAGQREFEYNLSIASLAVLMLLLVAGTWALVRHAFAPITTAVTALDALSSGEIEVEVLGEDRRDEVGAIARAVRVVRDRSRDGLRQAQRENRSRRRQEHFIRQQMIQIGATLDEDSRRKLMQELHLDAPQAPAPGNADGSGLGMLATAFQVMTRRVVDQSAKMDQLVAELREALAAKTELIGLQQQFEITHRMQAEMLPAALPPRPDVLIRGGILPAKEFGGDFYDFFPLSQHRVGVLAGHVSGHGLTSVFLTLTARNLLKAGLFCDLAPGMALSLTNRLMAAENKEQLAVSAFAGVLDTAAGTFRFARAGFATPILARRLGDATALSAPQNALLGLAPQLTYAETSEDIPQQSTLVLTSPGFTEADGARAVANAIATAPDLAPDVVVNALMSMAASASARGDEASGRDRSCVAIRYLQNAQ